LGGLGGDLGRDLHGGLDRDIYFGLGDDLFDGVSGPRAGLGELRQYGTGRRSSRTPDGPPGCQGHRNRQRKTR